MSESFALMVPGTGYVRFNTAREWSTTPDPQWASVYTSRNRAKIAQKYARSRHDVAALIVSMGPYMHPHRRRKLNLAVEHVTQLLLSWKWLPKKDRARIWNKMRPVLGNEVEGWLNNIPLPVVERREGGRTQADLCHWRCTRAHRAIFGQQSQVPALRRGEISTILAQLAPATPLADSVGIPSIQRAIGDRLLSYVSETTDEPSKILQMVADDLMSRG